MQSADFILIQVFPEHEFYEVARIRPYYSKDEKRDMEKGFYAEGFSQNNGSVFEFMLHVGHSLGDSRHKAILLSGESAKNYSHPVRII